MTDDSSKKSWQELVDSGNDAYENGRVAQAELILLEALTAARVFGVDSRHALTLNNLAAIYHTEGKYQMAEVNYKKSLAMKEQLLGEDHPEVAVNLHNLATMECARGRYKEAEPFYKRALEIREKTLGKDHPDVAAVLMNYARLLRHEDRGAEAESLEYRARNILQESPAK